MTKFQIMVWNYLIGIDKYQEKNAISDKYELNWIKNIV